MTEPSSSKGKGKIKLTDEAKAERVRVKEQKAAEKIEKEKLHLLSKLDPAPECQTVTVGRDLLFVCTYTGITTNIKFSLPEATKRGDTKFKGHFLNPAVAIRWVRETQAPNTVDYYVSHIKSKFVGAPGIDACEPAKRLIQLGGNLTEVDYKVQCQHDRWMKFTGTLGEYFESNKSFQERKANKSSGVKESKRSLKRPRLTAMVEDEGGNYNLVPFDCGVRHTPLLFVPVSPEELKKSIFSEFDERAEEIPVLNDAEDPLNLKMLILTNPSVKSEGSSINRLSEFLMEDDSDESE
jgi:hypothetical protein